MSRSLALTWQLLSHPRRLSSLLFSLDAHLFPPQHFPVLFPTLVGHAELGMKLSLPLGHPVLFPKTSAPPGSQICFGWKEPGSAGALWRLCPAAIVHAGLGWGQCQSLSIGHQGIQQDFRTEYEQFRNCYTEPVFPLSLCGENMSEIVVYWMRHF